MDAEILNKALKNKLNSTLKELYIVIKGDLSLEYKDSSLYISNQCVPLMK